MDNDLTGMQLVVEVYDNSGNFEGEWDYEVTRDSLERWEEADSQDFNEGKSLVRYLLISRLREHCSLTWRLLTNNVCLGEFIEGGVPQDLIAEIPRLNIINTAVDKMYSCLSQLVIDEEIRMVH